MEYIDQDLLTIFFDFSLPVGVAELVLSVRHDGAEQIPPGVSVLESVEKWLSVLAFVLLLGPLLGGDLADVDEQGLAATILPYKIG